MAAYGNSIWDDVKYQLRHGDMLIRLIIVNISVFLFVNIIGVIGFFIGGFPNWEIYTNAVLEWLMLPTEGIQFLKKPWTIITHMFTHLNIWHIFFNMLWLFWFGEILANFIGRKKILPIYFFSGLGGAFVMIVLLNIVPALKQYTGAALGASAGVMGVVLAAATLVPTYIIRVPFIGLVQLKYIALFVVVLDLVSLSLSNTGGHLAHLGGAFFGYLYIKQTQKGNDWSILFYKVWDGITKIVNKFIAAFKFKKGPKVAYKNNGYSKKPTSSKKKQEEEKQKKMDAILDKISSSGYDSLSKEEKEFLFRSSQEN